MPKDTAEAEDPELVLVHVLLGAEGAAVVQHEAGREGADGVGDVVRAVREPVQGAAGGAEEEEGEQNSCGVSRVSRVWACASREPLIYFFGGEEGRLRPDRCESRRT